MSPDSYSNRLGSYSYDRNGNMVTDGAYGLTYDAADHLVQYGADVTYTYDGNDLRVRKNMGGAELVSVFSGGKVVAEYTYGAAPSAPSAEYVYLGGTLLASKQNGSYKFHLRDHLSVRAVVNDQTGEVKEQGHKPFGEPWYSNDTATKWKFTTYERDSDTMLPSDYAMARYDCNWLGRFLSPDPVHGSVGNPQSWNRYSYVGNDPTNVIDPSGRMRAAFPDGCYTAFWLLVDEAGKIWAWSKIGEFGCGGGDGADRAALTPGQQRIADAVNLALHNPKLAPCLNMLFGPGTILTNQNLPTVDTTKSKAQIASMTGVPGAYATPAQPVPPTGQGTVLVQTEAFYSAGSTMEFLAATYIHEVGNILAYQRFTYVPYNRRPDQVPLVVPTSARDPDIGAALETCIYGGLVAPNGTRYQ